MVYQRNVSTLMIEEIIALFPDAAVWIFVIIFELVAVMFLSSGRLDAAVNKRHQVCLRLFQPRKLWQQPVKPISPRYFKLGSIENKAKFLKMCPTIAR